MELQNRFVSKITQIEKLKKGQQRSKQNIDDLFNVLMQKAFRGELAC